MSEERTPEEVQLLRELRAKSDTGLIYLLLSGWSLATLMATPDTHPIYANVSRVLDVLLEHLAPESYAAAREHADHAPGVGHGRCAAQPVGAGGRRG